MSAPHVYLVLGAAGSGRREVVADLVENGLGETARPLLLVSVNERPGSVEVEAQLARLGGLAKGTWATEGGAMAASIAEGVTDVFLLTDGRGDPVEQVEAFQRWLPSSGAELGRVLTVVHCQLGHAHPELLRWYDACVHFSDAVLLNRREDVPNKWISDFVDRYRKQHFPCLIEPVKKQGLDNPAAILVPEARRISMAFDTEADWPMPEDDEPKKTPAPAEVDRDLIGAVDPYLERIASGRRAREIPDIAKFLPAG